MQKGGLLLNSALGISTFRRLAWLGGRSRLFRSLTDTLESGPATVQRNANLLRVDIPDVTWEQVSSGKAHFRLRSRTVTGSRKAAPCQEMPEGCNFSTQMFRPSGQLH
mmetsp:Transcript_46092/g.107795  ORF Transcript_46092/g.107795 Transcript_46092/m.107795 type:complete len:108 (+) Transcript_46092:1555-1878(+)